MSERQVRNTQISNLDPHTGDFVTTGRRKSEVKPPYPIKRSARHSPPRSDAYRADTTRAMGSLFLPGRGPRHRLDDSRGILSPRPPRKRSPPPALNAPPASRTQAKTSSVAKSDRRDGPGGRVGGRQRRFESVSRTPPADEWGPNFATAAGRPDLRVFRRGMRPALVFTPNAGNGSSRNPLGGAHRGRFDSKGAAAHLEEKYVIEMATFHVQPGCLNRRPRRGGALVNTYACRRSRC